MTPWLLCHIRFVIKCAKQIFEMSVRKVETADQFVNFEMSVRKVETELRTVR